MIQIAEKEKTKEERENNDDNILKGTREATTGSEDDKGVAGSARQTTGSESVRHIEYVRAYAIEPIKVMFSTAGYITLITTLVGHDEVIFEPCHGNPQARILCPGVVKLHPMKTNLCLQYRI